ncbi:amino acid adenylation domain-containing protein, partial [Dactylosporangium sp. NPDC049140]|uniref:amino acid adenylation domain-containing protein n=1 Tax=Dactylosporangium sp. NPDC049140 TaxID=3155647 RepID=UPI00340463B2
MSVLVGTADAIGDLPVGRLRTVLLDDPLLQAMPDTVPGTAVSHLDRVAYVMFTSGSTGRPKAVQVTHRGLLNYVTGVPSRLGIGEPGRSYALLQPPTTDFGNTMLFTALTTGGCLHFVDPAIVTDPDLVDAYLTEHAIDYVKIVPSHLMGLGVSRVRPARALILGGEATPVEVARELVGRAANHYGPTETTVGVATVRLTDEVLHGAVVPIGSPLPNIRLHVLDRSLRPVPVGVHGELYVGGAGLARGYRGRPELTAERFVAAPGGERLYRTGDVVLRRPDGLIAFLGRADDQVKVRGYRIEPGEVRAALLAHPAVTAAVVVADGQRLVGYLVPSDEMPSVGSLRAFLAGRLPEHMIPAVFVELTAIPLTANGKLDRAALPAPDQSRPELGGGFVAPRTSVEERLAAIWGDVLGVDRVGVHDNFFELGGHSLLATQVVSRIRAVFDAELPVAALFDEPTIAGLAIAVEGAVPGIGGAPIVPVSRDEPLPLSFSQQRLWVLAQLEPDSTDYNTPVPIHLAGDLDVDALAAALGGLAERHEVLRTRLVAGVDGVPYQVIDPAVAFDLPVVDLTREADPAAAAEAWLDRDRRVPFDLAAGPLFRASLLRLGEHEHILAIAKHHVVSDEWSAQILRRELAVLYTAARDGVPAELPPLPVQYADFAVWQRQWLTGDVLDAQLGFWRERLAGAPTLELPTDRPRPAVRAVGAGRHDFRIPADLADGLRALSRDTGASMFMTTFAAFTALLGRYSGQDDIVVGTPIAGRNRAETEGLIGFFINSLVLRTDVSGDPTFAELLGRVRTGTLEAYAHQDLPFEQLVDLLGVHRERSRSPLYQVLFNYYTAEDDEDGSADGAQTALEGVVGGMDLRLILAEEAGGLTGTIEYSSQLFDHDRIERLARHFVGLAAAAAGDRDCRLSSLPLLTGAERAAVRSWGAPTARTAGAELVPALIAGWAAATPGAEAVRFGERTMSYAELTAAANRLAHHLRSVGVGPEVVVGICLPRGAEFVTAVLAVWQAGGAYLPLDPEYPINRLSLMLADGGVGVVVGTEDSIDVLPVGRVRTIVVLDDPVTEALVAAQPVEAPDRPARPDHVAYVLFTSGSTGRPKGVQVTHRGMMSLVTGQRALYGLGAGDGVLQFASFGFDASVADLCLALAAGGRLVIADEHHRDDPAALAALVRAEGVHMATLPPSLLATLNPEDLDGLRILVSAGEPLDGRVAAAWSRYRLVNGYGPTEAAVCASAGDVDGTAARPPIGVPFGGSRLLVVDRFLNEVPVGVAGELYVGGPGLARGYRGRPDLTAERFVAGPDGGRWYRTGDVVRWRSDGRLEFVGRADEQVKVRGFRIEPGEIEHVLRGHTGVGDVVVVADGEDATRRLVAYVVPVDAGGMPPAESLRAHAQIGLPEYMVPTVFVELAALPLNRNGKVDRAALPPLDGLPLASAAEYVPPAGPVQRRLADIWAEVLDVERVGAHDDFFSLGGHSLLATLVMSRVRAVFGVDVAVAVLFDAPTVAELAEAVGAASAQADAAPPIVPVSREQRLPLSFAQQRLWFLAQLDPASPEYNLPARIRLVGDLDVPALVAALRGLVERHEVLRTRLVAGDDGVPVQVVETPFAFDVPVLDMPAEDAEAWLAADAAVPFDLAAGWLWRATLLRIAADEHVLALTMHHAVGDEWSAGILRRELDALYRGEELAPLPLQYADFAVWQRQWLTGGVLERQLDFWRDRLDGAPVLELPTDRPRPALRSSVGAVMEFAVPAEVASGLRAVARDAGASMFMTVFAAFNVLLSRYAGQDDVVVGTPIANRNRAEVEGLIGFFVNTLVLRTDLSGDPTFAELVGRVRAGTLDAYAHQDVPFEHLVDALGVDRDRSRTPLFQVLFNYANGDDEEREIDSAPRPAAVKADLSVAVVEAGAELVGAVQFSTALFDEARMVRLVGHFQQVLAAVAGDAGCRLSEVPLLTGVEVAELARWNDTVTVLPPVETVLDLIGSRDPAGTAVRAGDTVLTYGELWQRSADVAGYLLGSGVGPESVVGLRFGRGVEFVVAVLGVWRAGAAYLPLDPSYPAERLDFMVADAGAVLVLEPGTVVPRFEGVLPVVRGGQAAYVIYTSGSTGVPKGVLVQHAGVVNLVSQLGPVLGAGGVVLQFASFSFDAAVFDLAAVLSAGGTLVVATEEERGAPAVLLAR